MIKDNGCRSENSATLPVKFARRDLTRTPKPSPAPSAKILAWSYPKRASYCLGLVGPEELQL